MFKVSARTVLELGSELISSDIIAFYELIKNGFDAKTTSGVELRFNILLRRNAYLTLRQKAKKESSGVEALREAIRSALERDAPEGLFKKGVELVSGAKSHDKLLECLEEIYALSNITISDTGSGMSLDDLNKHFLLIGTSSRKKEVERCLRGGSKTSPFLGEKGIGRLSAMRLANRLRVETATKGDSKLNVLDVNWSDFEDLNAMLEDIPVSPYRGGAKPTLQWSGTRIIVSDLAEDWTETRVRSMAEKDFARLTDPFLDQKKRPRVVIFWNGKRLTIPWMNQRLISHAHASVSGQYEIVEGQPQLTCTLEATNLGFAHPREKETIVVPLPDLEAALIGTSQAVHDSALVSVGPFKFEAYWFNRRILGAIDGIGEMKAVRDLQQKWSGILLFRDGFRVFPYGDEDDDWLVLDRKALGRSGYALNKTQFIGRVEISRAANPELLDQTNREGLRETSEQRVFIRIMQFVINTRLWEFLKDIEKQYKHQKLDLSDAKSEISTLEQRAKTALKRLKQVTPKEGKDAIEDLQQTLFEFSEFAEAARQRISEVEQESRQMIEMAGIGLLVEVVAHELARASENALENLEELRRKDVEEDVRTVLESLRAQMKSLSKRVRVLDPLSIPGRQRSETFTLNDIVDETLAAHEGQFKRHNIEVKLKVPKQPVRVRAVKGMIVQILENLISNSKYWMQMRKARDPRFKPLISISLHDEPPSIAFEDNGRGVAVENKEKVFRPFFSLKEPAKRRGLGLFIAKECAEFSGGTLSLEAAVNKETGRLHRFTLELPESAHVK